MKVVVSPSAFSCYFDGSLVYTFVDTHNNTGSGCGIQVFGQATIGNASPITNFNVVSNP
jgi:hypothetical protein